MSKENTYSDTELFTDINMHIYIYIYIQFKPELLKIAHYHNNLC